MFIFLAGLVIRSPLWNRLNPIDLHRDDVHWVIEEEEHEKAHHNNTELHERKAHDNLNFIDS